MNGLLRTVSPLVLASGSLRRRDFLEGLGLDFKAIAPRKEVAPEPNEKAQDYSIRCSIAKGKNVAANLLDSPLAKDKNYVAPTIIAADTVINYNGEIIGKPSSCEDNFKMLCKLAGKTHEVISSFCIILPNGEVSSDLEVSKVTFWNCPHELLKAYAYTSDGMDKAGGYSIQDGGAFLSSHIEGSITNVIGLPLSTLVQKMLELKVAVIRH